MTKLPEVNSLSNNLRPKGDLPGEERALTKSQLRVLVEESNKEIPENTLRLELHETSNRLMVKLIDKNTEEVIKEIPSEEFLDMVGRIKEFMGVFLDERV